MKTVTIDISRHTTNYVISVKIPFDPPLIQLIKTQPNIKWNAYYIVWELDYSHQNLQQLKSLLSGHAIVDSPPADRLDSKKKLLHNLTDAHIHKIECYKNWLYSKRYSPSTIKTYTDALQIFLRCHTQKPVESITEEDLIHFNIEYLLKMITHLPTKTNS